MYWLLQTILQDMHKLIPKKTRLPWQLPSFCGTILLYIMASQIKLFLIRVEILKVNC